MWITRGKGIRFAADVLPWPLPDFSDVDCYCDASEVTRRRTMADVRMCCHVSLRTKALLDYLFIFSCVSPSIYATAFDLGASFWFAGLSTDLNLRSLTPPFPPWYQAGEWICRLLETGTEVVWLWPGGFELEIKVLVVTLIPPNYFPLSS